MRLPALFASSLGLGLGLAVVLAPSTASADIYEPNNVTYKPSGLLVPVDSSASGEEQLYTLFKDRGENITSTTWWADAQITPTAFSPLCGFTATFVLNEAGSHFGLAWYNETGTAPAASDLHLLVPANSAVGTTFTGTAIKSDPNYAGGLVGFALIGGETHYTNSAYDTECTNTGVCNPAGHWITALMYASTVTPNAYYICFEDGGTSSSGWNNDGDFNDDLRRRRAAVRHGQAGDLRGGPHAVHGVGHHLPAAQPAGVDGDVQRARRRLQRRGGRRRDLPDGRGLRDGHVRA
jgi:hypothetical protein